MPGLPSVEAASLLVAWAMSTADVEAPVAQVGATAVEPLDLLDPGDDVLDGVRHRAGGELAGPSAVKVTLEVGLAVGAVDLHDVRSGLVPDRVGRAPASTTVPSSCSRPGRRR